MTVPNPSTKYLLQSDVVDSAGSHDGTNSGLTFANDTTLNRDVAIFNGSSGNNQHFEAPSQLATEITSMYSVSMWVYLDSIGPDYMILFTDHRAGQAYASLDARVLASGQLEIRHRQTNAHASAVATSTATLQTGQWTHIAFAWSNVIGMAIYINGSLDSTKSMGYIPYNSTQPMKFGVDRTGSGYSNRFQGKMADIRWWSANVLDSVQIGVLYSEGADGASSASSAGKNYSAVIGVPATSISYDLPTVNEPSGWVVTLDNGQTYTASTGEESSWSGPIVIPNYAFGTNQKVGDSGIVQAGGFYIAEKPSGSSNGGFGQPIAYANALDGNGDTQLPTSWNTVVGSDATTFGVSSVYADPHTDRVIVVTSKADANSSGWENRMLISNRAKESTDTLSFTRLNSGVASGNITSGDIKIQMGSSSSHGTHVFSALKRTEDATPDSKSVLYVHNMFNANESYDTAPYRGELGGDGYLEVGTSSLWDGSDDFIMHTWIKLEDVPPNPMFVFGCLGDQSGFSLNLSKTDPNTQVLDNDIGILLEFPSSGGSIFKHWDPEDQGSVEIKPGKWHHIALSFNHNGGSSSSTHKFTVHLDGQKVGSFDQDVTINSSLTIGNGKTSNGSVSFLAGQDSQFRGRVAGFSVETHSTINRYNEDLSGNGVYSDAEIAKLHLAGVSTFGLECSGGTNGDSVGAAHTNNGVLEVGLNFKPQTQDNFTCSEASIPSNVRNIARPLNILQGGGPDTMEGWIIPCDNGYLISSDDAVTFSGVKLKLESTNGGSFGVNLKGFAVGMLAQANASISIKNDLPQTIIGVGVLKDYDPAGVFAEKILQWSANDTEFNGLTAGDGVIVRSTDNGASWEAIAANEEPMTTIETTVPIWGGAVNNVVLHNGVWVVGGDNGVLGLSTDNGSSFSNIDFVEDNLTGNNPNITGIHFGGASKFNSDFAQIVSYQTVKKPTTVTVSGGIVTSLGVISSSSVFCPTN